MTVIIDYIDKPIGASPRRDYVAKRMVLCRSLQPTETFFSFFLVSSYVGFVPVSDVLAIFVSDRRCEFW